MNKQELSTREEFLKSTFILAKSSPMAWHNFIAELDKYANMELERALGATTTETLIAVGMGRRLIELRNDFRNIDELGRKLNLVA